MGLELKGIIQSANVVLCNQKTGQTCVPTICRDNFYVPTKKNFLDGLLPHGSPLSEPSALYKLIEAYLKRPTLP